MRRTFVGLGALMVSVVQVSRVGRTLLVNPNLAESGWGLPLLIVPSKRSISAAGPRPVTSSLRRDAGSTEGHGLLRQESSQANGYSTMMAGEEIELTNGEPLGEPLLNNAPASDGSGAERQGLQVPSVERTLSFGTGQFGMGFRNSAMAFTWFVMYAVDKNYTSIVVESLNWEDFYGRGRYPWGFVPHALLFDVEHWNAFYPQLPRLMSGNATRNSTLPVDSHGTYHDGFVGYQAYSNRIASDPVRYPKSPTEIAMLKGAFRPSQEIRNHMNKLTGGATYAALHARIEPDMQKHMYCVNRKVFRLSDIVRMVEAHFPNPAFDRLFVAINRPMLEAEVKQHNPGNDVAADNLRELNRIRDEGMWNGTVTVFEAGSSYMRGSDDVFGSYVGISGAVLDYFLALQSSIFIGTEVSSFSADLIQTRFYRSEYRNYHYRPDGLRVVTHEGDGIPPNFVC